MAGSTKVLFYYDIVSMWSYIALTIIKRYESKWQLDITLKPMFLGAVMQAAGNKPPISVPNKGAWMRRDMDLQASYANIKIKMPAKFPISTISTMRFLRVLEDERPAAVEPATFAFYRAFFERDENVGDVALFPSILKGIEGLDESFIGKLVEKSNETSNKDRLKSEATALVNEGGAFGFPWHIVTKADGKSETFWGSDRYELMAHWLGQPWQGPNPQGGNAKL